METAMVLEAMKKAGEIQSFDKQVPFECVVNDKKICTYFADFVVTFPDGRKEIYDSKGMRTPTYRLKKKLVEALYGVTILEK